MLRLKVFLLSLLLICPLAFCHGQLSFYGVNGEKGYAALRGTYKMDLDNGLILTPAFGYYRRSDKDIDEAGSTSRYGLTAEYWWNDVFTSDLTVHYIPQTLGFESASWLAQAKWLPFYRWGIFKNPEVWVASGQTYYHIYDDVYSHNLPHRFSSAATDLLASAFSEAGPFDIQILFQKVIKYSNRPARNVSSNWADVPFMTAVLQGFVEQATGARVHYRTRVLTPYISWARYRYANAGDVAAAVSGGINIKWGDVSLSGGVEVFEPRRQNNRKTYFSVSADMAF